MVPPRMKNQIPKARKMDPRKRKGNLELDTGSKIGKRLRSTAAIKKAEVVPSY